ncbi:MAG: hypothetical protein Q7U57_19505 [Methylovulum sp.]|nr:hypothetical protein [Methylovulum sp.]
MIVLRDPDQLNTSLYPGHAIAVTKTIILIALTHLLRRQLQALSEPETYDPDEHGYIVIAEPGDGIATLETETGYPLLSDWFDETQYGDDGFAPTFEWLDNHAFCYEMGLVLNDNGFTVLLIIPKLTGIDAKLLKLCRENALEGSWLPET